MICPYCLSDATFELKQRGGAASAQPEKDGPVLKPANLTNGYYECPGCREEIPAMYVKEYSRFPPLVLSGVGFSKHGKSVYLSSLFHSLRHEGLAEQWSRFFSLALDDESLEQLMDKIGELERGKCPESSPKNFGRPTLLRLTGVPGLSDSTLAVYDVGGEVFGEGGRGVETYANFLLRARTVMFIVSIPQLVEQGKSKLAQKTVRESVAEGLTNLLNTYILGIERMGGRTAEQNLIVVYAKADILASFLKGEDWGPLRDYINTDSFEGLNDMPAYIRRMREMSHRLEDFTARGMSARMFLSAAHERFNNVHFCMCSGLGAPPDATTNELTTKLRPLRVLDPLLFVLTGAADGTSMQDELADAGVKRGLWGTLKEKFGMS